jgi:uncharacterized RDD family membrane protein YckC
MTCTYCGFRMGEAEHRCRRCGRTPDDTLMPGAVVRGSLAPQLRSAPVETAVPSGGQTSGFEPGVQARLFQDEGGSKVIQFPGRGETQRRRGAEATARTASKPRPRRARPSPENQSNLDFRPARKARQRTLATTVDAVIHCDDPVAARLHRAVAAAFDWSLVVIGYGLFLLVFRLAGGAFALNRTNLLALVGALALIAFAYGVLWVIAGSETAGMRWTGLRLVTFGGFPPEPKQRLLRFAGSCLSVCTVVGLVWSLWDEESLTWQDHISGTFPTAPASGTRVFHRR